MNRHPSAASPLPTRSLPTRSLPTRSLPTRSRSAAVAVTLAVAACALLALLAAGCGGGATEPSAADAAGERWNVVLVLVDTLRADHLGVYGYGRPTSPHLDALAAESVRFERAYSQAGCTFPSVNSLLTSRYPAQFLTQKRLDWTIPQELPVLPELLRAQGYVTFAASASAVVRATPSRINRQGGFGRGFDEFDEECLLDDAACINDRFARFLDDGVPGVDGDEAGGEPSAGELGSPRRPFFAYLHYMEPHGPYQPPPEHPRHFAPKRDRAFRFMINKGIVAQATTMIYGDEPYDLKPAEEEHLVALYDEEVRYFDSQLAELLALLDQRSLTERTLFILASDHGEELFDHGHLTHCRDLIFDTVVGTPLIIRPPGLAAGQVHPGPVQNVDIMPTVLDYLGIEPPGPLHGVSLRPSIEGRARTEVAFASQGARRAVADGRFKLVYNLRDGGFQLYDLVADPAEKIDRLEELPEQFRRLRRLLFEWMQEHEADAAREGVERADSVERQLKAVGYL